MKSEHRHELKTNELAEWLINLPQWAKQNFLKIIYVSVLIVVVAGIYIWKNYEKNVVLARKQINFTNYITQVPPTRIRIIQAHTRGFDNSYTLLNFADELQNIAKDTKSDTVASLALIKQAELLRTELHYRFDAASKQDLATQINRAKDSYAKAISRLTGPEKADGATNPSLMAAAKFGLGLCEEELANFTKAEQIYRDIAADTSLEGTTTAAAANLRLKVMSDYQQKVVFAEPPEPILPKPAPMQPQIQLKPFDAPLTPQIPSNVQVFSPNE